jgi:hypothetical protein
MAEDHRTEALDRLRKAAARVRKHEQERAELVGAIVFALTDGGLRPSEVDAEVPYDRNHVRRIAKAAGVEARRKTTVRSLHDEPRSSA